MYSLGYASEDIIKNIFKVCKNMDMEEAVKLAFIKVSFLKFIIDSSVQVFAKLQEIGLTHQRIIEGLTTLLQMSGLLARLCMAAEATKKSI